MQNDSTFVISIAVLKPPQNIIPATNAIVTIDPRDFFDGLLIKSHNFSIMPLVSLLSLVMGFPVCNYLVESIVDVTLAAIICPVYGLEGVFHKRFGCDLRHMTLGTKISSWRHIG